MVAESGVAEVRSGSLRGRRAHRVQLRCGHGQSTFFLLPGRSPNSTAVALDVLWVRHIARFGCECCRATTTSPGLSLS